MRRIPSFGIALVAVALLPPGLRADEPFTLRTVASGPSAAAVEAAKAAATRDPAVQRYLRGTSSRLLVFQIREPDGGAPTAGDSGDGFRAVWFDYTHNRAIEAVGTLAGGVSRAGITSSPPLPNGEEFVAAVAQLRRDAHFGPLLARRALFPYPAMPPLVGIDAPAGAADRILTVELLPPRGDATLPHEIVGVDMIRGSVLRYAGGAPPHSSAAPGTCGYPDLGGGTYYAGDQIDLTVYEGTTHIWDLTVVRPAASSAYRGSGVELHNVQYRGKLVLERAHAPILNVLYTSTCGPYRDWLWSEDGFMANGSVNAGFMDCTARPQTILEDGSDAGNFLGVAYYLKGSSLYLVTECDAGWYRYAMEWQLDADGTIHPRFGFAAVQNSCVCYVHTHHVYWRLDFDIDGASSDVVTEETPAGGTALPTEVKRRRTETGPLAGTTWLVQNPTTGDAYRIVPGRNDGTADSYGQGDLWFLQYHQDGSGTPLELDDHPNEHPDDSANLDQFLNSESIQNQHVVVWYAGHFVHNANDTNPEMDEMLIGPDIVPVSW